MQTGQIEMSPPFPVDSAIQGADCQWDSPGGEHRVTISGELERDLEQAAIQGLLAIPRRGLEIGGLLFGRARRDSTRDVYEITGFEEIGCEHSFGPSFTLSQRDRTQLAEMVERHERENATSIIGIYRSYTGREGRLDAADQELLQTYFGNHNLVCLLLRPLSVRKVDVSLQFWNSGEPLASEQPAAVAALGLHSADALAGHRPEFLQSRPPDRRLGVLAGLCCLLTGIAGVATFQVWKMAHTPPEARVALDARPTGADLQLTWSATKLPVTASTRGTMQITDGAYPFEIQLTPEQIRRGTLNYSPSSGRPAFHLRLFEQGREVADGSLSVVRVGDPVLQPVPQPAKVAHATPPIVRREVQPEISPGIRTRITSPTTIPVWVSVNAQGRVTGARSKITGRDGLERYLIDEAVKASYEWEFTPARTKDGEPVAATTSVSFEFTPER